MSYLVLVRHGLSEYNKKGLWTGWDNPPLEPEGVMQAKKTGEELKDIPFDYAYQSPLTRVRQTLTEILKQNSAGSRTQIIEDAAINERNYGDYTGKNKWEVKDELGEEQFMRIRRGWDEAIPNGETLKDVYDREIPYFKKHVFPLLQAGKNVIFCSSGNALRALVKYLENIPEDEIASLEIGTGEAYVYKVDEEGNIVSKQIRGENLQKGRV